MKELIVIVISILLSIFILNSNDELIKLMRIFIFNPISALIISGVFAIGAFNTKKRTLFVSATLWIFYALWESYMLNWRSPTGDMAIRVDMVLVIPIMVFVSIYSFLALNKKEKMDGNS